VVDARAVVLLKELGQIGDEIVEDVATAKTGMSSALRDVIKQKNDDRNGPFVTDQFVCDLSPNFGNRDRSY